MGSKKKIGVRVDEDVYERFVSFVEDTHGRTHGVIGNELERALRQYMESTEGGDPVTRIEDDVASINASVADLVQRIDRIERKAEGVEADGRGGTLSNTASHTHTPTAEPERATTPVVDEDDTDDVPNAKAPKSEKAAYVFASLDVDGIVLHPNVLRTKIDKTWSFGERATDDLVERIFERYHAKAVQKEGDGDNWQVALGKSPEDREDAIDDFGNDEPVFVAEKDGTHVEGSGVFDVVN